MPSDFTGGKTHIQSLNDSKPYSEESDHTDSVGTVKRNRLFTPNDPPKTNNFGPIVTVEK